MYVLYINIFYLQLRLYMYYILIYFILYMCVYVYLSVSCVYIETPTHTYSRYLCGRSSSSIKCYRSSEKVKITKSRSQGSFFKKRQFLRKRRIKLRRQRVAKLFQVESYSRQKVILGRTSLSVYLVHVVFTFLEAGLSTRQKFRKGDRQRSDYCFGNHVWTCLPKP